jgi:uncharacterized protein with NRDE domain
MCTLIALHRCFADAPLVVAANRDEFLERPTEGPALREAAIGSSPHAQKRVVAPRDLRAGGSWLGINEAGVFAAITNRRCEEPDPKRRSRGWLVMEALAEPSAARAADRFARLTEGAYNPFNLYLADAESAHLLSYQDRTERFDLGAGAHVIGNVHPDEPSAKIARLRADAAAIAERADAPLAALADLCRAHLASPFDSTCVHAGEYGTRSSTLLRTGARPELHYADGPPCEASYRDLTPLLHDLGIVPARERISA